jgi:flavin-dependent dehydrogenase
LNITSIDQLTKSGILGSRLENFRHVSLLDDHCSQDEASGFRIVSTSEWENGQMMVSSVPLVEERDHLKLVDGSKVAVIGGGPAGSFVSYFLLEMASRSGLELDIEIFEPRDFSCVAPKGCNMCGGIISETLVQNLAAEGINLPSTIVQRGIESYMLHTDVGSVRIETPVQEKRIGAVYRGAGPRDLKAATWGSFDHHLEQLTTAKGAHVTRNRVVDVSFEGGRPQVAVKGEEPKTFDLLVVAVGVNSAALKHFTGNGQPYTPPESTKTFITEYYLGEDVIEKTLGDSMHVFLLNIPRLEFAAIIPKRDYASVCLLGESIDKNLVNNFLDSPQVKACMPDGWTSDPRSCQCSPKISIGAATQPFADRLIFVGDCGVTRLYKDGIGAAYRTAKACATTAVFEGISEADFRRHYWPVCRSISIDNSIGKLSFAVTRQIQKWRFARRALLRMTEKEQRVPGRRRDMSRVLWDMFTGSAPYRDIVTLAMHPRFLTRLLWELAVAASPFSRSEV